MTTTPHLTDAHYNLLDRIRAEREYYAPLSAYSTDSAAELQRLRDLAAHQLVRYCPYPEEFWIAIGNVTSSQLTIGDK